MKIKLIAFISTLILLTSCQSGNIIVSENNNSTDFSNSNVNNNSEINSHDFPNDNSGNIASSDNHLLSGRRFSNKIYGLINRFSFNDNEVILFEEPDGGHMGGYTYGSYSTSGNKVYINFYSYEGFYTEDGPRYIDNNPRECIGLLLDNDLIIYYQDNIFSCLHDEEKEYSAAPYDSSLVSTSSPLLIGMTGSASVEGKDLLIGFTDNEFVLRISGYDIITYFYGSYVVNEDDIFIHLTTLEPIFHGSSMKQDISLYINGAFLDNQLVLSYEDYSVTFSVYSK